MKQKEKTLKTVKDLPKTGSLTTPPPLENESPAKRLARLNADHARLTQEIRSHKQVWAERNLVAQHKRQTISTAELTVFRQYHAELSAALARIQTEIGAVNSELREGRAQGQAKRTAGANGDSPREKKCPLKQHEAFPTYFLLAAQNELAGEFYRRIEAAAKSMLQHALQIGIEL